MVFGSIFYMTAIILSHFPQSPYLDLTTLIFLILISHSLYISDELFPIVDRLDYFKSCTTLTSRSRQSTDELAKYKSKSILTVSFLTLLA